LEQDDFDHGQVALLLRLQLDECSGSGMPRRADHLRRLVIDELLTLSAPTALPEYADLLVTKARIIHEVGEGGPGGGAAEGDGVANVDGHDAVELCREAVSLLKVAIGVDESSGGSTAFAETLAHAYTWLGICLFTAGLEYEVSLQIACGLWQGVLQRQGGGESSTVPAGGTIDLLHTVATLFGLLGQSESQVLVYSLIGLLNGNIRDDTPTALTQSISALANAGHRVQQMGYITEAAAYFTRAEGLLTDECSREFWLYFSQLTLARGELSESAAQLQRAMEFPAADTSTASKARVASFSAEIEHHRGVQAADAQRQASTSGRGTSICELSVDHC
jgi:hypothetical protein